MKQVVFAVFLLAMASFAGCLDYNEESSEGNEDEKHEELQQNYILLESQ